MNAVDSSVVIAAVASWHEHHDLAQKALARDPRLVAHAAVESYSMLTRLPPPHRVLPSIAGTFLVERFQTPPLTLSQTGYHEFLEAIATRQIVGGPTYDALIAFTAAEYKARLLSLDRRAVVAYEAIGANVEHLHG